MQEDLKKYYRILIQKTKLNFIGNSYRKKKERANIVTSFKRQTNDTRGQSNLYSRKKKLTTP